MTKIEKIIKQNGGKVVRKSLSGIIIDAEFENPMGAYEAYWKIIQMDADAMVHQTKLHIVRD